MSKHSSFLKLNTHGNYEHDYRSLADSITTLPTLRSNIIELVQSVEDACETDLPLLVEKIRVDQSLVALVLKLARSSAYAQKTSVDTVKEAILLLGIEKVRDIALSARFLGNIVNRDPYQNGFNWKAFWLHANAVGVIASIIAKYTGREDYERYYTAGLLHDLGKMGAFCIDEENMLQVANKARFHGLSFIEAECACLSTRHDLLGSSICKSWTLPEYLRQVCRYHHTYNRDFRDVSTDDPMSDYVDVVILANYLAKKNKVGYSGHSVLEEPVDMILKNLSLSVKQLDELNPIILLELKNGSFLDELICA